MIALRLRETIRLINQMGINQTMSKVDLCIFSSHIVCFATMRLSDKIRRSRISPELWRSAGLRMKRISATENADRILYMPNLTGLSSH